jgi:hypothetical protein
VLLAIMQLNNVWRFLNIFKVHSFEIRSHI